MSSVPAKEKAVRVAASALDKAISDAREAGYSVAWPSTVAGLNTIQISETRGNAVKDGRTTDAMKLSGEQLAEFTPVAVADARVEVTRPEALKNKDSKADAA